MNKKLLFAMCFFTVLAYGQIKAQCDPNTLVPAEIQARQNIVWLGDPVTADNTPACIVKDTLNTVFVGFKLPQDIGAIDTKTGKRLCEDIPVPSGAPISNTCDAVSLVTLNTLTITEVFAQNKSDGSAGPAISFTPDKSSYTPGSLGCVEVKVTPTEAIEYNIFVKVRAQGTAPIIGAIDETVEVLATVVSVKDSSGACGGNTGPVSVFESTCDSANADNAVSVVFAGGRNFLVVEGAPVSDLFYRFNTNVSNPSGLIAYAWDFGNGASSNLKNPDFQQYSISDTGEIEVSLMAIKKRVNITRIDLDLTAATNCYSGDIEEPGTSSTSPDPQITGMTIGGQALSGSAVDFDDNSQIVSENVNIPINLALGSTIIMTMIDADVTTADDPLGTASFDLSSLADSSGTATMTQNVSCGTANSSGSTKITVQFTLENTDTITGKVCFKLGTFTPGGIVDGVDDLESIVKIVSVSPNPNNGSFDVSFTSEKPLNAEVSLVSLLGSPVYSESIRHTTQYTRSFNQGELSSGIYVLRISSNQGELTKKIVIY